MKKTFLTICLLCALVLASNAANVTVTNLVTYGASGGASTNYGAPVFIGTAIVSIPPNIVFSHGSLVNTNAVYFMTQVGTSASSNLMSTISTTFASTTNQADEVSAANTLTLSIYLQTVVVTTNNSTVGTKAVFSQ